MAFDAQRARTASGFLRESIEKRGLPGYAADSGMSVEEAYETLMTGLAVRYYNAVAG